MTRRPRAVPAVVLTALLNLCAGAPGIPAQAVVHARTPLIAHAGAITAPRSMWTRAWQVRVRAAPNGTILTELDIDQEVRATGHRITVDGVIWLQVSLWGALTGWTAADLLALAPLILPAGSWQGGGVTIPTPSGPHAPMPLHALARVGAATHLRVAPSATAATVISLAPDAALTVSAWATDAGGLAWYAARAGRESGWVSAESTDLLSTVAPRARLSALRGTGMWLTPAVLGIAPPEELVKAARRNGITHLYVEVANSGAGGRFLGGSILDRLLPVAHRAHIAVIAWVYPFLANLPADVTTAVGAATYITPTGERVDGLAADIESNLAEPLVKAYGQLLRTKLGDSALLVATVYPPQTYWGRRTPYRAIVHSFDLIAPMDYWHVRPRSYSAADAYTYVRQSIAGIRKAGGNANVPIEVLGQMYDAYGNGRHSPSGAEIQAAWRAARDGGAEGISFFEWNHATPDEWDALRQMSRR